MLLEGLGDALSNRVSRGLTLAGEHHNTPSAQTGSGRTAADGVAVQAQVDGLPPLTLVGVGYSASEAGVVLLQFSPLRRAGPLALLDAVPDPDARPQRQLDEEGCCLAVGDAFTNPVVLVVREAVLLAGSLVLAVNHAAVAVVNNDSVVGHSVTRKNRNEATARPVPTMKTQPTASRYRRSSGRCSNISGPLASRSGFCGSPIGCPPSACLAHGTQKSVQATLHGPCHALR